VSDLFREIEEDLQRDRYKKLWDKYGNLVITAAVVLVAATAGWQGWKAYRLRQEEALGQRYETAIQLAHAGKTAEAEAGFAKLAADANAGYSALSRLQEAALLAKAGKREEAIAVYDKLAQDGAVERPYRDLATLFAVMTASDSGDPSALIKRLEPLSAAGSPWRYSALELTAALATRMGDKARAEQLYSQLSDDAAAPSGVRARAAEMLAALKG